MLSSLVVSAMFWDKVVQASSDLSAQIFPAPKEITAPPPPPTKTLIFAPHPDDEIICCTRKIREKLDLNEEVKIIYLTDGDALSATNPKESKAYGRIRRKESMAASRILGLNSHDLLFLGFPDSYLSDLGPTPLQSIYTKRTFTPLGSYIPGVPFTEKNLKQLLSQTIQKHQPTEIYIPSQADLHPDHKYTGAIAKEIIKNSFPKTKVFEYTVHTKSTTHSKSAPLNEKKLQLLNMFRTQFHDQNHARYMESFAYRPEVFEQCTEGETTTKMNHEE